MDEQRNPDVGRETRPDEPHPDAGGTEAGAAGGAVLGTLVGGPVGLVAGAAAGAAAGGAADGADPDDRPAEAAGFEREGQPGDDDRTVDLADPRLGGHVGGSDPDRA